MSARVPIAPALLRPVLAPDAGPARTLPAEAYTSQAVFDWEAEHFFEAGWVCVGRADELAEPGDQRAFRIGSEGILVVRDQDGELRGFYNTCRHRGHELLEPGTSRTSARSSARTTRGSTGSTDRSARRRGSAISRGSTRREYPLIAARIAGVARLDLRERRRLGARASTEYVGNLDELDRPLGDRSACSSAAPHDVRDRRELEDDHRELPRVLPLPVDPPGALRRDPGRLRRELPARRHVGGRLHGAEGLRRDDVARRGSRAACGSAASTTGRRREVYYFGLFPNLLLSLHPDYVMTHRFEPLGPGRDARSSASGSSRPRPRSARSSRPTTPASSGTSRTGRTGSRASRSTAGCSPRGSARGRSPGARTRSTSSWRWWPRATSTGTRSKPPQVHEPDAAGV